MVTPRTAWKYRKLAWKHRGLWKYRSLWQHRKDILAAAITAATVSWAATHPRERG
ncbi:MAG: hypothetical protein U0Q18_01300 [Bryobacteraceae bacterium]